MSSGDRSTSNCRFYEFQVSDKEFLYKFVVGIGDGDGDGSHPSSGGYVEIVNVK